LPPTTTTDDRCVPFRSSMVSLGAMVLGRRIVLRGPGAASLTMQMFCSPRCVPYGSSTRQVHGGRCRVHIIAEPPPPSRPLCLLLLAVGQRQFPARIVRMRRRSPSLRLEGRRCPGCRLSLHVFQDQEGEGLLGILWMFIVGILSQVQPAVLVPAHQDKHRR
jgi:hypothetical protein